MKNIRSGCCQSSRRETCYPSPES